MSSLPLVLLVAIFAACAAAIWVAGIKLSQTTDVLATRLHFGEALGGLILLALATNLPEIAITASAAIAHNLDIAIGNILGGIAIQTVVLAILDAVGVRGKRPLSYRAASLSLVLEGTLVIGVLVLAVMGSRLPSHLIALRVAPVGVLIFVTWVAGIWLIGRSRHGLPWHADGNAPDGQPEPRGHSQKKHESQATHAGRSTAQAAAVFAGAALVTLAAGVVLERSGDAIAGHIGMTGVLFGATVLAAATSLPELSTGLESVKMGDYQLAFSDIFGGNAFLPVLFLVATLLSGQAALPQAKATDIYLTGLGALLTVIYICGLIFRPTKRYARMGVDSIVVVCVYVAGVIGLIAIARS